MSGFVRTKNPTLLVHAAWLSVRQGRIPEIARSVLAELVMQPSPVTDCPDCQIRGVFEKTDPYLGCTFSREGLKKHFGERFASLPDDFQGTRWSCVCHAGNVTVIGEYFEEKRIFLVGNGSCRESRHYHGQPDVRHIHSVVSRGGDLLVSTGDARKALDLWRVEKGHPVFKKRLRKHSAGYTAAAAARREIYFGTDFSSRANWIETLGGRRHPYPGDSYRCYVEAMQCIDDRFVVSVNKSKLERGRKIWSVFDTDRGDFLYCGDLIAPAGAT
ncbi:MAG: hypothetical protein R6V62_06565 [Candidatus Fermentibacteraceae bacterium]